MDKTEHIYKIWKDSTGVCTDTRKIEKGNLFIALKGENFDGNNYAQKAIDLGAKAAVIDNPDKGKGGDFIEVENALHSLQKLARYHRDQLDIPFIGLTGSNGKTTTKELITEVLSTTYRVAATKGNLNNHIGVPLTILDIDETCEIAVIEMGANRLGDIAELCEIANPSHGLITNIGKAHIGTFGGQDNILRGKSELYDHLIKKNGVIWVNSLDERLLRMSHRMIKPLLYPGDYYNAELLKADPFLVVRGDNGKKIKSRLPGKYNFSNIVAALAVGKFFDVDAGLAAQAIAGYQSDNNRSQIIEKGSNTLFMDAYNANPTSMQASIENFNQMKTKKHKIAVLGDMLELGEDEMPEHENLGKMMSDTSIQTIYVGELMKAAHDKHPGSRHYNNASEVENYFKKELPQNSIILLKGSRKMKLEDVIIPF